MSRRPSQRSKRAAATIATALALVSLVARTASACDVCAIYTATALQETRSGFWAGLAEQFTRFDTETVDGHQVENPGEYINSSTSQLLLGYNFDDQWGLQLTVPFVYRSYRRLHDNVLQKGDVAGVGDVSLLAHYNPLTYVTENTIVRFSVLGGLKYPTGDADKLKEAPEDETPPEAAVGTPGAAGDRLATGSPPPLAHHSESDPSGIHGHDLALGSGSLDGIVGATLFWSWKRLFSTASVQYKVTTEGAHDYQFANELSYTGGLGAFVLLGHAYTLALQGAVSGESKGTDTQHGEHDGGTAITSLYAGPRVLFTYKRSLQADLTGALPVIQNTSGLQLVPDYRIQGGVVWRF